VADLRIGRALMCIVNNESKGLAKYTLGDTKASGGPSIGLMQGYRGTAEDMKLWTRPPGLLDADVRKAYEQLAGDEALGISWGVAVFKRELELAGGDIRDAIRRYNGSGPSAEDYRDRALEFAKSKGWTL
jgi:hypothetical protein